MPNNFINVNQVHILSNIYQKWITIGSSWEHSILTGIYSSETHENLNKCYSDCY